MEYVIIHFSKLTAQTPRVNSNVNQGLWVMMMMYQYFCNKCTILARDADNDVGLACAGAGSAFFSILSGT